MKIRLFAALALFLSAAFAFAQEPTIKDIDGLVLGERVLTLYDSPVPVCDQPVTGYAFNHLASLAYCTRDELRLMGLPNPDAVKTPPAPSRLLGKNDKAGSYFDGPLLWDSDAGRLALFRVYDDGRQATRELLLYDFLTRKLTPIISEAWVDNACWSSDGKLLAYSVMDRPDSPRAGLWVLEMKSQEKTRIVPRPALSLAFVEQNNILCYQTIEPANYCYTFAIKQSQKLEALPLTSWRISPDGRYLATLKDKNLAIRNLVTGNQVFSAPAETMGCWFPYSNDIMVFLGPKQNLLMTALSGPSQGMVREVTDLMVDPASGFSIPSAQWSGKIQQLPDRSEQVTWLAFVNQHKLFIKQVWHREFSGYDKIALGQIRSNESEILLTNMKQVTLAALMFADDNDDTLPAADDFLRLLTPYVRGTYVFERPGHPKKPVVKICYKGAGVPLKDIEDPADTVVFKIDLGSKEVILGFADGHAVTRSREIAERVINNPNNALGPNGALKEKYAP